MTHQYQSVSKKILFVVFTVLLTVFTNTSCSKAADKPEEQVYCTQDAKLCPDGSYVGRSGPKCEFAPCPGKKESPQANSDSWKTYSDSKNGISFNYPEKLPTEYISTVDWPPLAQVLTEPFVCNEASSETARAGKTEKKTIGNQTYCITKITEGAAGSIYTQYAYAFPKNTKTVIFTFSLKAVQCGNYDEQQKNACENERASFNIDSIADRMAQSVQLVK